MSPAHSLSLSPLAVRPRARSGRQPAPRAWLRRLERLYGRAGMLDAHR